MREEISAYQASERDAVPGTGRGDRDDDTDGGLGAVGDHPQLVVDKACRYGRGGLDTVTHMVGGQLRSSEVVSKCQGRGGAPVKRYQREYYYVCEEGKLAQTRLSFSTVTKTDAEGDNSTISFNTSAEGQNGNSTN